MTGHPTAAERGWITVEGPGRCVECSFHVPPQGHRDGCSTTGPLWEDLQPEPSAAEQALIDFFGPKASPPATMLDHAIEYARNGWEVGPLCHVKRDPATGKPAIPRVIEGPHGKNPCLLEHGVLDFSRDIGTVTRWWSKTQWNIGVRVPESMFVLDVDGPDRWPYPGRGLQALAELEDKYGPLPATLTQITGSGGLHLFFRKPHGKLSEKGLPDGLEYKDHGGQVVAAPSIHPDSGEAYVWCDHPVAAPPQWLIDLIVEPERKPHQHKPRPWSTSFNGPSIADTFSSSTSWADILMPHGWELVGKHADPDADGARWLHPEATSSCSATVRNGCLFVYSCNTPFEVTAGGDPNGYTRFRAYALLNFNGDMSAAARSLKAVA